MDDDIELKSGNVNDQDIIGYVTFEVGDTEMVRLCGNGDIRVKGKLVENDKELVDGLRKFLKFDKIERRKNKIKEVWKRLFS